ncbi:MAG: DUF177 domain-containing protein [Gammaproteobacteria bacterium]|nr:DUF177 domain-containing protein [Gammaproteobacteria bacterium]
MSPPWSRPLEIDRLADGGANVDFEVPLAQLEPLRTQRPELAGHTEGRLHFTRDRGWPVAELALRGEARLNCQRCLQPLHVRLEAESRVALVASEADATRVPEDLEPMLAPGGRTTVGALITEELLLALPIVALHPAPEECPARAADTAAPRHRPFAGLGDLLKRSE